MQSLESELRNRPGAFILVLRWHCAGTRHNAFDPESREGSARAGEERRDGRARCSDTRTTVRPGGSGAATEALCLPCSVPGLFGARLLVSARHLEQPKELFPLPIKKRIKKEKGIKKRHWVLYVHRTANGANETTCCCDKDVTAIHVIPTKLPVSGGGLPP
ncbi:hypothetical protein NDU88_002674 [Pleurodeles waltl]|uniref:Uncharacterized protein n=1 Tax=Pleurodeles waltl TaxID=8319 RepID=A0AAV7VEB1_PLEWA|nr:hypothetical protein NDU88_002674 [Pleurodeles waltl]